MEVLKHANFRNRKHYPKGMMTLFFVELFFMVGFMFIFSLLVLYLTKQMGFTDANAYKLFAAYGALVYGFPILGGYLGGRCFGYKHAVLLSLFIVIIGLCSLSIAKLPFMFFGLACFVIGTGVMTPCLYVLIGRLFSNEVKGRDSGFTIVYIGLNIGGLAAAFSSGIIQNHWGFSTAFFIGAVCEIIALLIFVWQIKIFNEEPTELAHATQAISIFGQRSLNAKMVGYITVILSVIASLFLMENAQLCNILLVIVSLLAAVLVIVLAIKEEQPQRRKMLMFLALGALSLAFWIIYMLAPSALTIFIEQNVNRHLGNLTVPTASIMSLDPFYIVVLGPLFSLLWFRLSNRGRQTFAPAKIMYGVTCAGIGYLFLVIGIQSANQLGYIALYWIVICYFFTTVGELLVAPIGYALVGRIVPRRYEGLMMGIWQLVIGFASAISGYLAKASTAATTTNPLLTNHQFSLAFGIYGLVAVCMGLLGMAFIPKFRQIMQS